MWSTSPADRILIVPPFVEHFVGTAGGVVETALPAAEDPLALLLLPLLPHPAASNASPATAAKTTPSLTRPRFVVSMFMALSFLSLGRPIANPPCGGRVRRARRLRGG